MAERDDESTAADDAGWRVAAHYARLRMRSGRRFVVAAALVTGLTAAASLATAAGARRASTVYDRLAQATRTSDLLVLPNSLESIRSLSTQRLQALPGVAEVAGVGGVLVLRDGAPLQGTTVVPFDDALGNTILRPVVREGRLPNPDAADEMFATPAEQAELGIAVGERIELTIVTEARFDTPDDAAAGIYQAAVDGTGGLRRSFLLTGVGMRVEEAARPDSDSLSFTPALYREAHPGPLYVGYAVRLRDGGKGEAAFEAAVAALAPGGQIQFQTGSATKAAINRPLRPQVIALTLFAIVTAIGAAAAWGQAVRRRQRIGNQEAWMMMVLGMPARIARRAEWIVIAVAAAVAVLIAVAGAFALSGIFPRGDAFRIEPTRGLRLDRWVLGGGAAALAVVLLAVGMVAASGRVVRARAQRRSSRTNAALRRVVSSPAVGTGVSAALDADRGLGAAPTRSTLVGAVVGFAAVAATTTFAFSLSHFVSTPREFGWGYDVALDGRDLGPSDNSQFRAALLDALPGDHDVVGWAQATTTQALVGGRTDTLMGVSTVGGVPVGPTLLAGHLPAGDREVAVGSLTASALRVRIGDSVPIGLGANAIRFVVVGIVVLPGLQDNSSDVAALGAGALVNLEGMRAALGLDELDPSQIVTLVTLRPDASPADFVARMRAVVAPLDLAGELTASGPALPAVLGSPIATTEVRGYREIRSTPVALAALLGALCIATAAHALLSSVRRRRRELGTLQALGFTRGQVRAAVVAQSITVATVGLAVGVPIGVVAGRQAWRSVTVQLGVANHPIVPVVAVFAGVVAVVAVFGVMATVPAGMALRLRPADVLREE